MPQIRPALALIGLCLGGALAFSGCGDQNSRAVFGSETGRHPAGWLPSGHSAAARASSDSCFDCHGDDLQGGISRVSCTQCHLGGNFEVHPEQWGTFAYARHAGFVAANGSASCALAVCHGTDLLGGGAPSCGVNCHMAVDPGTGQPQRHAWLATNTNENIAGHLSYFATNPRNYDSCRNHACHGGEGTDLVPPGVFLSGPGCINSGCHTVGPGNPVPDEAP